MSRSHSVFAAAAVVTLGLAVDLVSPLAQQQQQQRPPQQQQQPQQPTFRGGVNLVRVDVIVTDKRGAHVADLTPADFEVFEDGRPQRIDSFRLVRIADEPQPAEPAKEITNFDDEEAELGREGSRLIVLLLDDYHVRMEAAMRIRSSLRRFISALAPTDLVAVMYPLTPVSALRFTRDRFALTEVVDRFEGRRGIYTPRNDAEGNYSGAPPEVVEQIRNQVSLSALESLVVHLGGAREGRKSVILVSEGFLLPPEDMRELEHVYSAANRANTAIYAVDPGGLSIAPNTWAKDTLQILSENTDGRAIVNRNDIAAALNVVLSDSASYYLLGYNSDLTAPDGKFHEIKVRVKRPGVEVRARKGYWAPSPEEAAKAAAPPKPEPSAAVANALGAIAVPAGGRSIRTWVGISRGENGKTRVTFTWKPAPPVPGAPPSDRPARVSLTVIGADGTTCFRGVSEAATVSAPASAPAASRPASTTPPIYVPARVVFDAPPGKLQVKVSVESDASEVLEADVRDFVVPDLRAAGLMLTTPAVYVGRTPRETRELLADSPDAAPTPDRQFSRTDRVFVRVNAYGPGTTPPIVTARLLNRNGQEMTVLSPQAAAADPSRHTLDLPLAGLAAGEYLVEITATSEAGEARALVAIKVGS
jgi:VWFA-related protein